VLGSWHPTSGPARSPDDAAKTEATEESGHPKSSRGEYGNVGLTVPIAESPALDTRT
jgi:hypothetical protein